MNESYQMRVAVSVATVWTSPDSPRPLDDPAVGKPADIEGWLASMTVEDKLDLCDANRVQTQLLYGTEVIVTEVKGEWANIRIPDQSTSKNMLGYPGWVPMRQLSDAPGMLSGDTWAEVISPLAELRFRSGTAPIKVSFLTRLPVAQASEEEVVVHTPDGLGVLQSKDILLIHGGTIQHALDAVHTGFRIVDHGMQFVGLPYLWGGMSAYGYDCSGFVYSMCKSQGILLPRDTPDQARGGREIDSEALEPGDMLFFAHDKGKGRIHHVGIYVGDDRMLHSPNSRGCIEVVQLTGHKLSEEHCTSRRYWT